MNRTIYVKDASLWEAARIKANANKISLSAVIESALAQYVKESNSMKIVSIEHTNGIACVTLEGNNLITLRSDVLAVLGWTVGYDLTVYKNVMELNRTV